MKRILLLNYNIPYPLFFTILAGIGNQLSKTVFFIAMVRSPGGYVHGECWFSMEEVLP
jgi:hypothetical protein